MKINSIPDNYYEIIENILNNSLIMRNDILTFLLIRSDYKYFLEERNDIGGGNFLSLAGLMLMLGMQAKIYYILSKSGKVVDKYNKINETDAFIHLVINYPNNLGFNINDKNLICKTWNNFRDRLVHFNLIGENNFSRSDIYLQASFDEIVNNKLEGSCFDFDNSGSSFVNTDLLLFELVNIKDWILMKVRNSKFNEKNIIDLLNWFYIKGLLK